MDEILKYFPDLTDIQKEQFVKLDFCTMIGMKKSMLFLERYWRFVYQTYTAFVGNS
jgi:hypothetical protein